MLTPIWISMWVLTVTYVDVERGSGSYGAAFAYQLQYKDQQSCLKEAEKQRMRKVIKKGFIDTVTFVNEKKSARCDRQDVLLGYKK